MDVCNGPPQIHIVGLHEASVRESRERVRSAIRDSGFDLPPRVMVANLAPADLRKEAAHLDLAVAMAFLSGLGQIHDEALAERMLVGELGLDGSEGARGVGQTG